MTMDSLHCVFSHPQSVKKKKTFQSFSPRRDRELPEFRSEFDTLNPKHTVIAFKCRGRSCFLHGFCRNLVIVFLASTCCVCAFANPVVCALSIRVCERGCNYTQIQYITVGRFSGGFISTKLLLTPPPSILFNMTDVFIHFRDKLDTMHPWCWHK